MLDRKTPPPFNRSFSFSLLEPAETTLPNGLQLLEINGGAQDVVKAEVIVKAGRWYESVLGTSHFTSHQLSKGTSKKNSFEIAQLFDHYGAHLEINAGVDFVFFGVYSLTKNLKPVLNQLLEIFQEPVFPEKELLQSKSIYLQNLKVNQEKTSFLASRQFRKTIFGESHPYGKEIEESDLQNIGRDQVLEFYRNFFRDIRVVIAGKIDDAIRNDIHDILVKFPVRHNQEMAHTLASENVSEKYINKDDSVQTSIRVGKKFIQRSHPDYANVLLLNHIFGGYFGSRLMKNIREEKGFTYGIHSSIHSLLHDSYLVIGADVNKENRGLTVKEIRHELKRLRIEKIDEQELDTARYHFIGSLQSELSTPFAHADKWRTIVLYKLEKLFYHELLKKIERATADDLLETANKYFQEDSFWEVSVG